MPFPDLLRKTDPNAPDGLSTMFLENTGLPDNGDNTFEIPYVDDPPGGSGLSASDIDEDWLDIRVVPLGPSVTAAAYVSLSADKRFMTINFTQSGADLATVTVRLFHSLER